MGLPISVREPLDQAPDWQAVSTYFWTTLEPPDAGKARGDTKMHRDKLLALRKTTIPASLKAYYQDQLDSLKDQIEHWLAKHGGDTDREEQLKSLLREAQDLLNKSKFEEVSTTLEKARIRFVQELAIDLDQRLDAVTQRKLPAGFNWTTWEALKKEVKRRLEPALTDGPPAEVIAAYESAYSRYLEAIISALEEKIIQLRNRQKAKIEEIEKDLNELKGQLEQATPDKKSDIERDIKKLEDRKTDRTQADTQLNDIALQLQDAQSKRLDDDLLEAEEAYNTAREAYNQVGNKYQLLGKTPAPVIEAEGAPAGRIDAAIAIVPSLDRLARKILGVDRLRLLIRIGDLGRLLLVIIVAVFLGLNLLWINNPTWGGWADYLIVILWGLGLHQVAGAAFPGVSNLTEQLTSQSDS